MLRKFGRRLVDYLTGINTARDLTHCESVAREFYPERVRIDDTHDLLLIQTSAANIKNKKRIYCGVQSAFTLACSLPVLGYLNGELHPKELALQIGAVSLVKGILYISGRREVKERKDLYEKVKEEFLRDDSDDSGEEWKRGTDYPNSDEL